MRSPNNDVMGARTRRRGLKMSARRSQIVVNVGPPGARQGPVVDVGGAAAGVPSAQMALASDGQDGLLPYPVRSNRLSEYRAAFTASVV